ncbi:MAG: hypothetical protein DMF84_19760 [Acidobacteria bacterium]|nr:MAG: hypothetical protein DMF84_19760 [Acidobacteriota bacterium]
MVTHVKVLGVLYILVSALGLLAALFLMLAVSAATGIVATAADPHDAAIALPIIGISGTALVTFLLLLSAPGLITGIGLLKYRPWARILGIVLSAINLIHIPIGTALGIYGLWVLLNKDTEGMFKTGVVPSA